MDRKGPFVVSYNETAKGQVEIYSNHVEASESAMHRSTGAHGVPLKMLHSAAISDVATVGRRHSSVRKRQSSHSHLQSQVLSIELPPLI